MTTVRDIEIYRARMREILETRQQTKRKKKQEQLMLAYKMARLYMDEGYSYTKIAKKFHLTRQRVHQLIKLFAKTPSFPVSASVPPTPVQSTTSPTTQSHPEPNIVNEENIQEFIDRVREKVIHTPTSHV